MGGDYHEPYDLLDDAVRDRHRALLSLQEELEAADWYDQRVAVTADDELKEILAHNRDEEKEHAAMVLEWLRRRDAELDAHLRTYLFTDRPITAIEEEEEQVGEGGAAGGEPIHIVTDPTAGARGLGIGSLRGVTTGAAHRGQGAA